MKYLVTLDANSPIGKIYANGDCDGFVTGGKDRHPFLDCTQIVTDSPYYISATRPLDSAGVTNQILFLPHGSVVSIHGYDASEPPPFGFVPS